MEESKIEINITQQDWYLWIGELYILMKQWQKAALHLDLEYNKLLKEKSEKLKSETESETKK